MWGDKEDLQHVQFSIENVTPICHSIKHLSIESDSNYSAVLQQTYSTAFILCHFFKLETLDLNLCPDLVSIQTADSIQASSILLLYLLPSQSITQNNNRGDDQFAIKWSIDYAPTRKSVHLFLKFCFFSFTFV